MKDIFDGSNVIGTDTSASEQSPLYMDVTPQPENNSTLNTQQTKQDKQKNKNKHKNNPSKPNNARPSNEKSTEKIYLKALAMRNADNNQQAFITFKKAAYLGHVLAMGAMGRAYFLAEGVTKNPETGLAWLINAANLHLPQALSRVEFFKINDLTLYQDASVIAKNIKQDIINTENSARL